MTAPWKQAQLQAIDEAIRKAGLTTTDQGTVQSADPSAFRAMVIFDGTTIAMPVKVAGHVGCVAGDRVCLQRFGSDWVVMAAFALRWPGSAGINQVGQVGSTATNTFANMPGSPAYVFTKRWTSTRVKTWIEMTGYADTLGLIHEYGVLYTGGTTVKIGQFHNASTGGGADPLQRHAFGHTIYISGMAAGTYTANLRWRRNPGAGGTWFQDADDWISAGSEEVA